MLVDVHTSFFGSLIFFAMSVCAKIQEYVSTVFSLLFIKPLIFLSRIVGTKRPQDPKVFTCLDLLKLHHRFLYRCLLFLFWIEKLVSGISARYDLYDFLLSWNQAIPLRGFVDDRTTFTIETLGKYTDDGTARGVNLIWLSCHKYHGRFLIISKEVPDGDKKSQVQIQCAWISGEHAGQLFVITKLQNIFAKNSEVPLPSVVYLPPRIVVFSTEAAISAGAILAFFQLTKGGWEMVAPYLMAMQSWFVTMAKGIW